MSLRILFADDSVTAQNMGRKILTDAGYDVVAVSNGAAAVKKIAEQKPDIIILDVYMPGYSGLEVCEKVRGSVATLKTPVLLTVGKMEPYKPEETNRVRADGVIVKPFEASDLLAIVKKFEERIGQAPPPVPEPAPVERIYEEVPEEAPLEIPEAIVRKTQATVDVPDHMATSSAFSDLLGTDSGHSMNNFNVPPPAPAPRAAAPAPTPIRTQIPEYVAPDSWRDKIDGEAEPFSAAVPATSEAASDTAIPETISRPPLQIPVYQEREEVVAEADVLPTAAPPTGEIEIPREPELQESAAEQTRNTIADTREPGLIATVHEESAPPTTEAAQPEAIEDAAPVEPEQNPAPSFAEALATAGGPVAELPVVAPLSHEEMAPVAAEAQQSPASDSDFEARVAAAMAAYGQAPESDPTTEPVAVHAERVSEPAQPASQLEAPSTVTGAAPAKEAAPSENVHQPVVSTSAPAPSVDYYPPARYTETVPEREIAPERVAHSPVVAQAPSLEKEPAPAEVDHKEPAPAEVDDIVAASVEAAVPVVAAAAAGAGASDHHTIAQAVHRVMERLKPELVEEIMRELKPKE